MKKIRSFNLSPLKLDPRYTPIDLSHFSKPLDLEIGCGVGLHPISYAKKNPERYLIALERTQEKAQKFFNRIYSHAKKAESSLELETQWEIKWNNLWAIHADAVYWTSQIKQIEVFDRIFILYPNPELKNKAKRWFAMPYFEHLMMLLKSKGEIHLASNQLEYIEESKEYASHWGLELKSSRLMQGPQERYQTHFEKKYLLNGELCYHLVYAKTEN